MKSREPQIDRGGNVPGVIGWRPGVMASGSLPVPVVGTVVLFERSRERRAARAPIRLGRKRIG